MYTTHRGALAALVMAFMMGACGGPKPEQTADAIYTGGDIVTIDDARPRERLRRASSPIS